MIISLIDADNLCYIGKETDDESVVLDKVDEALFKIITESKCTHYIVFVEPLMNNNFRKKIIKSYKANRANKPLPPFYETIKSYLASDWEGLGLNGYESDDLIISAHRTLSNTYPFSEVIICGMDKDYKQKEITFFDTYYRRFGETSSISKQEAEYNFYHQMIKGDLSDNIKGMKGKGDKYAESVLNGVYSPFMTTCRVYRQMYGSRWQKEFIKNYTQLRLIDNLKLELKLNEVIL